VLGIDDITYKNEDKSVLEQVLKFLLSDVTPSLKNMEMTMCVWLEDEVVSEWWCGKERCSFSARKVWFENTKKQMNLHNVKMITESASAHHVVGALYPMHFREVDEMTVLEENANAYIHIQG
jgi:hypothetical protein